jgi:hypothetical protein
MIRPLAVVRTSFVTPLPVKVTGPEPSELLVPAYRLPADKLTPPLKLFAPVRVRIPEPDFSSKASPINALSTVVAELVFALIVPDTDNEPSPLMLLLRVRDGRFNVPFLIVTAD